MNEFEETYENLVEKLEENRKQLDLINEELLRTDNKSRDFETLINLKNDLIEVIELIEDLIKLKENGLDKINLDSSIGRIVELFYKGNKRFGKIESKDELNNYNVVLFGNNKEKVIINEKDLKFQLMVKNLSIGEKAQALYEEDGHWYNCIIREVKENGYLIKYLDYNDEEFVSFDKIRKINKNTGKLEIDSSSLITTPGGYKIPEYLIVKSDDSEKVKQEKRRKISVIKKQQKNELLENQAKKKQKSWKDHMNKFQKDGMIF